MTTFEQNSDEAKVRIEVSDELDMTSLTREFRHFCLAVGFHPDTVTEVLGEDA